ncbi:MAG: hypothetical protein XU15_C0002G0119 [candidate division NC10 bacterium CSP1-5]|nr:MAG: hypothetical protein XU15_C0002G0119 [candidate division NC10 bacterium CSP1-5]HLE04123.1 SH3 domain-containing protein [Anaerolineales bacterium]
MDNLGIYSGLGRSILSSVVFLVLSAVLLSACAGKTPQPATQVTSEERAQHRATSRELEGKIGELQLHLQEQETRLKEMQRKLDEAIEEVVRAKAKMHSLESKAEAASTMAEAEIALKVLEARMPGEGKGSEAVQAEHLLKMSLQEFEKQNYGGALYLVNQAKDFIKAGEARLKSQEHLETRAGEVFFAAPIALRMVRTGNVREGPGSNFRVLFTLGKGTPLVGHSRKSQWVRIEDQRGRAGWTSYTLVEGW